MTVSTESIRHNPLSTWRYWRELIRCNPGTYASTALLRILIFGVVFQGVGLIMRFFFDSLTDSVPYGLSGGCQWIMVLERFVGLPLNTDGRNTDKDLLSADDGLDDVAIDENPSNGLDKIINPFVPRICCSFGLSRRLGLSERLREKNDR